MAMVSSALEEYLAAQGDGESFDTVSAKPPIRPAPEFDGSQPLSHYFISSSHNTYLLGDQLWGAASPKAYTTALQGLSARAPARCVEIDVWHTSSKGLIVTHGHTFTGSIPFKDVCEAINEVVAPNDLPVFISLECHVDADKQPELVKIMEDVWGDKLLKEKLQLSGDRKVSPDDLRGRIVMMVEWYPPPDQTANPTISLEPGYSHDSDPDDSDNPGTREMKEFREAHKKSKVKISDALARLGIYSNSIKPTAGWLDRELTEPINALINVSETELLDLLKDPKRLQELIVHGQQYMRRCYPKGLRVDSDNMDPMPIWRCGTHVVGLNMQTWDKGTHINGALFRDTQGLVLKPSGLLGGPKRTGNATLKLTVVGGNSIPSEKSHSIYVNAKLYTHEKTFSWKTKSIKDHKGDPFFNETVEWCYGDDDLIFLKVEMKEDEWGKDEELASYSVLVDRLEQGLRFWPLFDNKGIPSQGRLLVNIEYKVE